MLLKMIALFLFLGICLAIPIEDFKYPHPPLPANVEEPSAKLNAVHVTKPDNSDLKTDPSTWWPTYYYTYPVYYYNVHHIPTYTYWRHYY